MATGIRIDILQYDTTKQRFATRPSIKHHIKRGHCPISLSMEEASALGIRPSQAWLADYCEWCNVVREASKHPFFNSINSLQQFNQQGRSLVRRLRSELGTAAVVSPFQPIYSNIEVDTTAPWHKLKDLNYGFLFPFQQLPISEPLKRRLMIWRMRHCCREKLDNDNRKEFLQEGENLLDQILWELNILFLDHDLQLKPHNKWSRTELLPNTDSYFETISEVIESWNKVKNTPDYEITTGTLLFKQMLESNPNAWNILPFVKNRIAGKSNLEKDPDFQRHSRAWVQMLDLVIQMLGPDMELVEETLKDVGKRHMQYGVTPQHYRTMGRALICALEQLLGDEFSSKVKDSWKTVYSFISNTMIQGYNHNEYVASIVVESESETTRFLPRRNYSFRTLMQKVEGKYEEMIAHEQGSGRLYWEESVDKPARQLDTTTAVTQKIAKSDQILKTHCHVSIKTELIRSSNAAA